MSATLSNGNLPPGFKNDLSQEYPLKDESATQTRSSKDQLEQQKTLEPAAQQTPPTLDYGGCFSTPFFGQNSLAEVRKVPLAEVRVVTLRSGRGTIGFARFEPGWAWSTHMKPTVGGDYCQHSHYGLVLSGQMKIVMKDGTEAIAGKGDTLWIPPGHDGIVVGNEPCLFLDAAGFKFYARDKTLAESQQQQQENLEHPLANHPLIVKNQPDERMEVPNAKLAFYKLGPLQIGHFIASSGWKWSASLKPIMKTELCEASHVGIVLRGREQIVQKNGTSISIDATNNGLTAFETSPGHDAWVVGNEEVEGYDFALPDEMAQRLMESRNEKQSDATTPATKYPEPNYCGCFATSFFGAKAQVEIRQLPKAELRLVPLRSGKGSIGLVTFQPGWSWRECIQPLVKTDWCQQEHYGVLIQGEMYIRMKDGTEKTFKAGDAMYLPAGHDAHVVGNQPAICIDAQGMKTYGEQGGQGGAAATGDQLHNQPLIYKNFNQPDESKDVPLGNMSILHFGPTACIGRMKLKPGWKWSTAIKPIVKTEYCEHSHLGFILSGKLETSMKDGSSVIADASNGPAMFEVEPGHDAQVIGDQDVEVYDITLIRDFKRPLVPGGKFEQAPAQIQQPQQQQ